jgi:aminotransferase
MHRKSVFLTTGHKFRTKNISKRVQRIFISPIKEMSILADIEAKKPGPKIISFGQGIPYFDTPSYIKQAVMKALKEPDTGKYTLEPGITELRELVANHLEKTKGVKNIQANKEIMISAGCQEAIDCALASVIDPGDNVLLLEPAFASHIEQILQWGGEPIFVPFIEKRGWRFDIKECERRITNKTKAILFSNPSNPTGMVFRRKEIVDIAKFAKKHDLIVITDETYDFLTYDGVKHFSPISLPYMRDRVILCGSFSKKYAMTGYRVGFAFSTSGIIDHMLKVHDSLMICAPAISQKAAIAALKGKQNSVAEFVAKLSENRELMCEELNKLSDYFEYQKPLGAYYIMVKYKKIKMDSFTLALKILKEARLIVIPGAAFGPSGEGHLRFSFAVSPQEIKEGFKRLREWLKNL